MLTKLDVALTPAARPLAGINGRWISTLEGQSLQIDLIDQECRVDEVGNRVVLGFALDCDTYAVWMRRRGYWKIDQVVRSLEDALNNGNLTPSEPFGLDDYMDSD
jgi:hypothetical protein